MIKKVWAAIGLLMLTGACATQAGFEKRINPTIGMTEAQLIAYAGKPPDQTYKPDGDGNTSDNVKFISWTMTGANTTPGYVQCVRGICVAQGGQTYQLVCTINFELRNGIVTSYKYHGNSCVG